MATNRGVAYIEPGKVEVRSIDFPKLRMPASETNPFGGKDAPHGVILKVVTTNICGSDQHMVRGRTTAPKGLILGHEITGEIVEKGSDVEMLNVGDLVTVPFNIACGRCRNCRERKTGICLTVNPARPGAAYGYVDMGGWVGGQAEYVMVPYADFNLIKLPNKEKAMSKIRDLTLLSDILPTGFHGAVTAFGLRGVENLNQYVVRIDYQINDKHALFGRYMASPIFDGVPYEYSKNVLTTNTPTGSPVTSYGANDLATSATLGETWLISGATVNSFRLTLNRVAANHPGPQFFGPSDIGVNAYSYLPKFISLQVAGGPVVGQGTGADLFVNSTQYQLNDDISLVRGSHQWGFGVSHTYSTVYALANVFSIGVYPFTGAATGLGMSDFLMGRVTGSQQAAPNGLVNTQRFFGLYAQDSWKVTSHLTLNYGVRWDPFFPMQLRNNTIFNFTVDRFNQNVISKVISNAPAGFLYPGDSGFVDQSSIKKQWANFQPRLGFAWDPTGDGRTSIRGGAGIAYDFMNQQLHHNTTTAAPFGGRLLRPSTISFDNPWAGTTNPFPYVSGPGNYFFPAFGTFQPIPENLRTPRVYNWNLSIQRQVTQNWFTSASYVGSNAIHLLTSVELNPAILVPNTAIDPNTGQTVTTGTCPPGVTVGCNSTSNINQRRILYLQNPTRAANIGQLTQYDDGATQSYHGLLLNTTWRTKSGININANYTWSHCIADTIFQGTPPNPGQNPPNSNNRSLDRGNCIGDRRHLFNLTAVAQTPRFENAVVRMLGTGWTTSAIYRYTTGAYLNVSAGVDRSLTGVNTGQQRVNLVNTDYFAPDRGSACAGIAPCMTWLNSTAFAQPALGTNGNIGYQAVLGPAFWQFDMALSRQFRITEGQHLEVRGEAFNILNSIRPQNPATSFAAGGTFGRILSAYDPRIMQFALKYVF
jgi:hypothetical protein